MPEEERAAPTYWDYLKLDRLLDLQGGLEDEESSLLPDELHFIIVHQAYELWFKLILRELRFGRDHLAVPRVPEERIPYVVHHLRRVNEILKVLVSQFAVMETLTPQDFLAFRDKLVPASGFQSFQLRELEILLGLEDELRTSFAGSDPLTHIEKLASSSQGGSLAWGRIESARSETTVQHALHDWLHRTPIQGSQPGEGGDEEVVQRFLADYLAAHRDARGRQEEAVVTAMGADPAKVAAQFDASESFTHKFLFAEDVPEAERPRRRRIRAGLLFIESYRDLPLLAWPRLLLDTVVELEEHLVLFRGRHARMVERVIGRRVGTGGSAGVDYLDETTRVRIFRDLWAVRSLLLSRAECPELERPEIYGFAAE